MEYIASHIFHFYSYILKAYHNLSSFGLYYYMEVLYNFFIFTLYHKTFKSSAVNPFYKIVLFSLLDRGQLPHSLWNSLFV